MYEWYQPVESSLTLLSVALQISLIYMVVVKSPKSMGYYRIYLVVTTANDMILTLVLGLFIGPMPGNVFPGSGLTVTGIASWMGEKTVYFMLTLFVFLAGNVVVWQNYGLAFRFVAILPHENFSAAARKPICTVLYLVLSEAIVIVIAIGMTRALADQQTAKELLIQRQLYDDDPLVPGVYRILFNTQTSSFKTLVVFVFFAFLSSEVVYLFCVWYILHLIRRQGVFFSRSTYRMHRQLTMLLGIQLLVPLICVILPVCAAFGMSLVNQAATRMPTLIGIIIISSQATIASLMTIFFLGPYRRFVVRKLTCGHKVVTVASSSISGLGTLTNKPRTAVKPVQPQIYSLS